MYLVKIQGHPYSYAIREMMMQYFMKKNIVIIEKSDDIQQTISNVITNGLCVEGNMYTFYTIVEREGQEISKSEIQLSIPNFLLNNEKEKWIKRKLKTTIYRAMEEGLYHSLPWGILTGIRPTKIVHQLLDEGKTDCEIIESLKSEYLLHHGKALLLIDVALKERNIIYPTNQNKVSLYIGIPFCPSRCIYCSFVSFVIEENRDTLKKYLAALHYEIIEIAKFVKKHHIMVESIYIGGGTPTVLTPSELENLLCTIKEVINIEEIKEYTLEAGRPDTINEEKLKVAHQHGITRISINPQTMNQSTLKAIGRNHSTEEVIRSYHLAREIGFSCINMDLILGLPGEDVDMVKRTLKEVEKLDPENVTVHTMAIKRGSKLKEELQDMNFDQEEKITQMLKVTQEFAQSNGYVPYYLYRQKYMIGNLENVGYCKSNYKGIYNIQIMAEKQTIIGLGAGSASKFVFLNQNRIERIPNVKNVDQYIQRIQEMVDRKIIMLSELFGV